MYAKVQSSSRSSNPGALNNFEVKAVLCHFKGKIHHCIKHIHLKIRLLAKGMKSIQFDKCKWMNEWTQQIYKIMLMVFNSLTPIWIMNLWWPRLIIGIKLHTMMYNVTFDVFNHELVHLYWWLIFVTICYVMFNVMFCPVP